MTLQEYKTYINKANNGTMPDDMNPAFILSTQANAIQQENKDSSKFIF